MGAATLRRGEQVLLPRSLPSVSGADHLRALTDLRREMGLEVLAAKKAGGYTQAELDEAVADARGELTRKLNELQANIAEQQKAIDAQQERIDALPDDEAAPAEHPSQEMNASDAVTHLEGLRTVEAVEAMIAAENEGKGRKGVLKACAEHIKWLNEPD